MVQIKHIVLPVCLRVHRFFHDETLCDLRMLVYGMLVERLSSLGQVNSSDRDDRKSK
jgi:hypothetical protein